MSQIDNTDSKRLRMLFIRLGLVVFISLFCHSLAGQIPGGLGFEPPAIGRSALPTRQLPITGGPSSGNLSAALNWESEFASNAAREAGGANGSRYRTLDRGAPNAMFVPGLGQEYRRPPFPLPAYLNDPLRSELAPASRAPTGPYVMSRLGAPQQAGRLFPPDQVAEPNLEDPWGQPVFRPVTAYKESFFQKLQYSGTLIGRGGGLNFGLYESKLAATFALPMPSKDFPLLITPGYNERYLSGPLSPDLPERIIDAYIEFMWVPKLSERWTGVIAIAPGVYSDMQDSDDDAFRITGKALARWDWAPGRWQLAFGLLYLDRRDIAVLPAGGLIWTPNDWTRWDLLFPTPKVAWRVGGVSGVFEDWIYLAGEFGGDQWSVARAGGRESIILRDYRLMIGVERKRDGGQSFRLESGIVMGRRIEFQSATPDYESDAALMVRAVFTR